MGEVLDFIVSGDYMLSQADDVIQYEAMLPPFIIEQIIKREKDEYIDNRVPLRIDIDDREPIPTPLPRNSPDIDGNRGVVEIIGPDDDIYQDSRVL